MTDMETSDQLKENWWYWQKITPDQARHLLAAHDADLDLVQNALEGHAEALAYSEEDLAESRRCRDLIAKIQRIRKDRR